MAVYFHEEDLPEGVLAEGAVAVDTETMGLITRRDRLCLVQISDGKGDEHLVRFGVDSSFDAPNLKAVLADPARTKLYHFGRFDLAANQLAQVFQVHVAGHKLGERVGNGDNRFAEIVIFHTGGAPERTGSGHVAAGG